MLLCHAITRFETDMQKRGFSFRKRVLERTNQNHKTSLKNCQKIQNSLTTPMYRRG
jgi:hypothetical protein